jgi:Lipocalin-like domain
MGTAWASIIGIENVRFAVLGQGLFQRLDAEVGRHRDRHPMRQKVDTAWHPAWIGTEQVRFFKVDSGVLSITTAWQT